MTDTRENITFLVFVRGRWKKNVYKFPLVFLFLGAQEAEVPGEVPPEGLYIKNLPEFGILTQ